MRLRPPEEVKARSKKLIGPHSHAFADVDLISLYYIDRTFREALRRARAKARSFKLMKWESRRAEAVTEAIHLRLLVRELAHWQEACQVAQAASIASVPNGRVGPGRSGWAG